MRRGAFSLASEKCSASDMFLHCSLIKKLVQLAMSWAFGGGLLRPTVSEVLLTRNAVIMKQWEMNNQQHMWGVGRI